MTGEPSNRTQCTQYCFQKPTCTSVIHEVPNNAQGETESIKGTCRRLYNHEEPDTSTPPGGTTFILRKSCAEQYFNDVGCSPIIQDRPLAELLKDSIMQEHAAMIRRFRTRFTDILRAYHVKASQTRPKRDTNSFLDSIPIVSHLYGILKSPWGTKKLRKHVEQLQHRFVKFAASVQRILTQNRSFQDEVLEILSTSMANVNSQLQGISCIINFLAAAMI